MSGGVFLMHQSFATMSPSRPRNSWDIDFSICKAQVLALHWGYFAFVKSLLKVPAPKEYVLIHDIKKNSNSYLNIRKKSRKKALLFPLLFWRESKAWCIYTRHCLGIKSLVYIYTALPGNQKPGVYIHGTAWESKAWCIYTRRCLGIKSLVYIYTALPGNQKPGVYIHGTAWESKAWCI